MQVEIKIEELEEMNKKIDDLRRRLESIETKLSENVAPKDETPRQTYRIEDLAKLSKMQPDTIRKNYLRMGKIAGTKDTNGNWIIDREEFLRQKEHFQRYHTFTTGVV